MSIEPLPASRALDQFFLEARSRFLDLAAILDRVERGSGVTTIHGDLRMERIRKALEALKGPGPRAETIQKLFSLEYDPEWPRPTPRY